MLSNFQSPHAACAWLYQVCLRCCAEKKSTFEQRRAKWLRSPNIAQISRISARFHGPVMHEVFDANLQRKWTFHPFMLFFTEKSQLSPTHGGFSGKDFWGRLSTRRRLAIAKALHVATCNPNYAPDHIIFGSSESKTNCHPKTKTQIVALFALHASSRCLEESYQKPDQNFMIQPFYPAPTSNII